MADTTCATRVAMGAVERAQGQSAAGAVGEGAAAGDGRAGDGTVVVGVVWGCGAHAAADNARVNTANACLMRLSMSIAP
jgi:hypothetical protein